MSDTVAVTAETCPHYLYFDHQDFERIGPAAKCAPPIRSRQDVEALWECVLGGLVDTIGSDHSPCTWDEKEKGLENIWKAWGGISGVQLTLPVLLSEGVNKRGLKLPALARMLSYNPARLFGLYPHKGTIQVGADADLVVVDLNHQTMSCFEGNLEVYFCTVSTGGKYDADGNPSEKWATPVGKHTIWPKLVSVHMTGGTTGGGYDLPGIGWTTLFSSNGVAVHSTFWHSTRETIFRSPGQEHILKGKISFLEAKHLFDVSSPVYDLNASLKNADFRKTIRMFYKEFTGKGSMNGDSDHDRQWKGFFTYRKGAG